MTKTRLEAFSDGVFAIIITLLILEVRIPDAQGISNHQLNQMLKAMMPGILTYFFTFLVVGVFWVAHHRIFSFVRSVDSTLLWTNIVYLMFNALIPFPASILARHPFLPTSILFYTVTLLIIGLLHYVFILYIKNNPHLRIDNVSPDILNLSMRIAAVGPLCYVGAGVFSFVSVYISFAFILGALVFYIFFASRTKAIKKIERRD